MPAVGRCLAASCSRLPVGWQGAVGQPVGRQFTFRSRRGSLRRAAYPPLPTEARAPTPPLGAQPGLRPSAMATRIALACSCAFLKPIAGKRPKPMSRRFPSAMIRCTQGRAPAGVTSDTDHWRPGDGTSWRRVAGGLWLTFDLWHALVPFPTVVSRVSVGMVRRE